MPHRGSVPSQTGVDGGLPLLCGRAGGAGRGRGAGLGGWSEAGPVGGDGRGSGTATGAGQDTAGLARRSRETVRSSRGRMAAVSARAPTSIDVPAVRPSQVIERGRGG